MGTVHDSREGILTRVVNGGGSKSIISGWLHLGVNQEVERQPGSGETDRKWRDRKEVEL